MKTITNFNFNVGHSNPQHQKLIREFVKEMKYNIKQKGRKSPRDENFIKLLISPPIVASRISTIILPSDPKELCNRLKLLLQEKQAENNCDKINEEFIVILDNVLEYKIISQKQHKQSLIKCSLFHTKKK